MPPPQKPAPGILAVHGYINSRETQDGFAIEFARRGYVVLALDQTGHGYSDPPSFANGFGGPDGLTYLRSLDMVDKANIGLEGHSMGGWTILAAAAAAPNDYKSMVLEGSSTGKPFAADGTPSWPRNVALVFAQYEEFSTLMWGVDKARDVTQSPKLWELFGTKAAVEPGKVYGDIATGTARVLYTPAMTHPAEHISHEAIGYSLDWFAKTLQGGTPRARQRPDLVPQGNRHADRADRLRSARLLASSTACLRRRSSHACGCPRAAPSSSTSRQPKGAAGRRHSFSRRSFRR